MSKNACVYCKSAAYGPGCPFSPNKIHFHASDASKCCYCGSSAQGPGCPFNPHNKNHVHGIEFNSMVKETVEKSITLGYLVDALSTPIVEMAAYKLGIINEIGNKINHAETVEEMNAYGPLEEYIIALKQSLGNQLGLIHDAIELHMESAVRTEDYATLCESSNHLEEKFASVGKEFNEVIASAYESGLSRASIEQLIVDSILDPK